MKPQDIIDIIAQTRGDVSIPNKHEVKPENVLDIINAHDYSNIQISNSHPMAGKSLSSLSQNGNITSVVPNFHQLGSAQDVLSDLNCDVLTVKELRGDVSTSNVLIKPKDNNDSSATVREVLSMLGIKEDTPDMNHVILALCQKIMLLEREMVSVQREIAQLKPHRETSEDVI